MSGFIKALLRAIALVGLVWLLVVGVVASTRATKVSHEHSVKQHVGQVTIGRGKLMAHPKIDINYMNKRKVPNGPDPIHNRSTGNSRRPPGQA